jgi:hypothetical protein
MIISIIASLSLSSRILALATREDCT